jgi:5-(carboxyamino)imidazole ribonucleotide mutase
MNKQLKNSIALILGSDSDWPVMKDAYDLLIEFEINVIAKVVSAHRTPSDLEINAKYFEEQNVTAIIAGAGGAAHLPGMMASFSVIPVIGVPVNTTALNGMDSLLSIVQMPKGIPVATVAINNSLNAAILALSIIGTRDETVRLKLKKYKENMAEVSRNKKLPI